MLFAVAFAKELPKRKVPLVVAPRADKPNPHDLDQVPDNIAVYEGEDVVLTCAGLTNADIESGYRVMWYEFITLPQGNPISDGNQVLPGHPNADRYSIEQPTADTFNLKITNVQGSDGGTYVCQDFNSFTPYRYKFGAQLIVICKFDVVNFLFCYTLLVQLSFMLPSSDMISSETFTYT